MNPERESAHFTEQDVSFDNIALHRLRSEGTPGDLLQAYRGMVQKYVEAGAHAFARGLQELTADLWGKLSTEEQAEREEIEGTIEA